MNNHRDSNPGFFSGIGVGMLTAGALAYFLGTKHGREHTTRILKVSENWETIVSDFIDEVIFSKKKEVAPSKPRLLAHTKQKE